MSRSPDEIGPTARMVRRPTPVEGQITRIWRDVLGADDVRPESDFFELGGDSLRAMDVISRVFGAFGVELSLRDVFEHPTVTRLAERVSQRATR